MLRNLLATLGFVTFALLVADRAGVTAAQEQSGRPPWARTTAPSSGNQKRAAPPSTSEEAGSQRGKIRVNVKLVSVLVSVLDEHNRPATDLPRDAFQVFEEGIEQNIEVFESETQQPLDLALMI